MNRIIFFIIVLLLLASQGFGQIPEPLEIRELKGMDTRIPDFSRPSNVPTLLENVDLRKTGSYGARKGYNAYYSPPGIDSIIGIISLKFSDQEEMMVALVDPNDSDWGKLIAFTSSTTTRLDTIFINYNDFSCFDNAYGCSLYVVVTVDNGGGSIISDSTIIPSSDGALTDGGLLQIIEASIDVAMTADTSVVFTNYYLDSTSLISTSVDTVVYIMEYVLGRDEGVSVSFKYYNGNLPEDCFSYEFELCQPDPKAPPIYWNEAIWISSTEEAVLLDETIIFDKMPITNSWDAEIFNDIVYFASGTISQVAWDRQNTFLNPPLRPGELWLADFPKATASINYLHGSYYYAVAQKVWYDSAGIDHSKWREPYVLTGPFYVDSGHVNITGFQSGGTFDPADISGIYDTLGTPDSVGLYLFRTRSYPEPLDNLDTLFKVKSWMLTSGQVQTNAFEFDTLTYIDSLLDSGLDEDTTFMVDRRGELLGKQNDDGVSVDVPYSNFYGGPYFVGDAGVGANTLVGWLSDDEDTLAWCYAMSYKDTVSGARSGLGPYLSAYTPQGNNPLSMRPIIMGPAPHPELCSDCIIEYWKAPVYGVRLTGTQNYYTETTTYTLCSAEPWQEDWIFVQLRFLYPAIDWQCGDVINRSWVGMPNDYVYLGSKDWTAIDTFEIPNITQFKLMGTQQIDGDPEFYDSVYTWADVLAGELAHPGFVPSATPTGLTNLGRSGDRMIGASGTRLWWSELGNINYWGAYNNIKLGASDGSDNITGFYSARGVLRVFGEDYSYNAYGETWGLNELSGKWGCVAPRSLATGIRGAYFLSNQGVIHETEGGELERKYNRKIISLPLSEFDRDAMPRATKREAVGVVYDNKYIISIPDDDVTWCWDELAGGWSRWTGITMGGTATKLDTLFFFKPGGRTIYSFGTSHLDAGNDVVWTIQLPPLFVDSDEEVVTDIGIWTRDTSGVEGFDVKVYGPNAVWDNLVDGFASLSVNQRHSVKALSPYGHLPVSSIIEFRSQTNLEDGRVFVDGFDIYYKKMNIKEPE